MNELAKTFILMCGLLPFDPKELNAERRVVESWMDGDVFWEPMIEFTGTIADFIELKAWLHVAVWLCIADETHYDFIYPYFERMVEACPQIYHEWPRYDPAALKVAMNFKL